MGTMMTMTMTRGATIATQKRLCQPREGQATSRQQRQPVLVVVSNDRFYRPLQVSAGKRSQS